MTRLQLIVIVLITALISGCSTGMIRPEPPTDKITITTKHYNPSTWAMPMGSVVPDGSNLVIHKLPKSTTGITIGMLFGPLGVVIANENMKSETRKNVSTIKSLADLKLDQEVGKTLLELRNNSKLGVNLQYQDVAGKGSRYEVRPYIYLEIGKDKQAQISSVVKVLKMDSAGSEVWTGQYLRHLPELIPVAQLKEGMGAADSELLVGKICEATKLATKIMVKDINGQLGKDGEKRKISSPDILALSIVPEWEGYKIASEDPDHVLIRSKYPAGSPLFFGVHIVDKDQATIKSIEKKG